MKVCIFYAALILALSVFPSPYTSSAWAGDISVVGYDARLTTNRDSLSSDGFVQLHEGIDRFWNCVNHDRRATVAFLGGSITAGKGWRELVMQFLEHKYPETKWKFINAGIPSLGSVPHAFRIQSDLLSHGPIDLLFVEAAVNDLANGTPVTQQRRALEGIVRRVREEMPATDIVMMAFADEIKLRDYGAGKVPDEVTVHEDIARYYRIPFINLAKEVALRIDVGEFTWEDDFKDLHPSPFGHRLYFRTIRRMFEMSAARKKRKYLKPHKLPQPLDPSGYTNGQYVSVTEAGIVRGFEVNPSWIPRDGVNTRKGFVEVPVLEGDKPGAAFELSFTGNAVGIAIVSGPDAGIIRYSIDGGEEKSIDLFTQWSGSLHLPWYLLLADDLRPDEHKLRITLSDSHNRKSKGTACRVVHFLVNRQGTQRD